MSLKLDRLYCRRVCFVGRIALGILFSLQALQSFAADPATSQTREVNPVIRPIVEVEELPQVLLIGDSISIGYTLPTRALLKGKANVHRIPANGGPTTKGVMEKNGIEIDDLYSFALPRLKTIQRPANVHFTKEGFAELAEKVAESIRKILGKR